jgi:acyl-CoA synthetase (AMP-forming)/AMP-acid ligase II
VKGSNPRAVLAADMELGAGNVLLRLAEHGADTDMARVTFDTGVDGNPAWTPLSLRTLTQRVAARAEWSARHGIGPRDPVAAYVTSAADVLLNFFALTWLGAIPALMNGSMPPEIAVEFIRRLRAVGVLADGDHSWLADRDLAAPVIGYAADAGTGDPAAAQSGQEVPVGEVGMVAMKSPTLALGYWNDSVGTFRTRRGGYYLTGDLMYRDEEGYFCHVDRASDAIDLGDGKWLYTALSEERIPRQCPDVRDCTLVAVRGSDGRLTVDILLALTEDAAGDRDREAEVRAALGEVAADLPLRVVGVSDSDIVLGPTGKVRKFLMRRRLLAGTSAP